MDHQGQKRHASCLIVAPVTVEALLEFRHLGWRVQYIGTASGDPPQAYLMRGKNLLSCTDGFLVANPNIEEKHQKNMIAWQSATVSSRNHAGTQIAEACVCNVVFEVLVADV